MIATNQIKAARALLDWDQIDLARAARLSLPTLSNLERGAVEPRQRTLEAIQKALEKAGIEFIGEEGVLRRGEILNIRMFEGKEAVSNLFEDVYEVLSLKGGDLLASGLSEKQFIPLARQALFGYLRKAYRHESIRGRLLVCEGDTHFVGTPEKSLYRWVEKESFGLVPYYIYEDRYAVISWGPPIRVIIVQNKALAETHRRQFEKEWKRAKTPPAGLPRIGIEEEKERKKPRASG